MRVFDILRNMNSVFGYVKKLEEMFFYKDLMFELVYLDVLGILRISDYVLQIFFFFYINFQFLGLFDGGFGLVFFVNWFLINIEVLI